MPNVAYEPSIIKIQKDGSFFSNPITNELFNSRILVLDSEVNSVTCSQLIKSMLALEQQDGEAPITLLITSGGGDVFTGLGLIGVMQNLSCPVHTVCIGYAASMAAIILTSGSKRSIYKDSYVMVHQPKGATGMMQQTDFDVQAELMAKLRNQSEELLAAHSNLTVEDFHTLTERDCWCDAARALELGLVDEIIDAK